MASITKEELAKHNKADDAWIVVDGDVYDVTKFAGVHPGGTQILLEYAGKDATEDFYALHRLEVLDKYQRLKKGRMADAKGPAPKKASEVIQEFSKVPFAEPTYLQGFKSPYFTETHIKLRQEARKFFCGETMEEALECEQKSTAPSKEMRKRMGELGIIAMVQGPGAHLKIPPKGLCGGVVKPEEFTYFHEMVVQEERCRTMCPGYEDGLDGAVSIGLPVLLKYGSEWMKNEVVPPIVLGEQTVVLSITEAFAGSDVAGLRTTAVLDASGENYIVNGTKKWITGGMYADWFVTAVRTGKAGAGGISMMLIPRSDAVQTKIMKSKYSSAAGTAYVTYENCIVPKKNLIGTENKGFQIIMSNFNHERWMITVVCIARARICAEETFKWSMQRKVFGKPLIEQPVIREKLAQMFAGVETCTQMLYDITYNMISMGSQGADVGARIALLKYQTTRMNHLVADNAVQIQRQIRSWVAAVSRRRAWAVLWRSSLECIRSLQSTAEVKRSWPIWLCAPLSRATPNKPGFKHGHRDNSSGHVATVATRFLSISWVREVNRGTVDLTLLRIDLITVSNLCHHGNLVVFEAVQRHADTSLADAH